MNFDSTIAQDQTLSTSMQADVVVITQDEAWGIQDVSGCDRRVAELDRYIARVVQYLTYCIAGQESGEMLSRAKGFSIDELISLYVEYINILGWSDENPFVNHKILLALCKIFSNKG